MSQTRCKHSTEFMVNVILYFSRKEVNAVQKHGKEVENLNSKTIS